jgi:hypothetical protein
MRLNPKQRSYLIIIAGFIVGTVCYEVGYYLIKGHTSLQHTPFILMGAFLGSFIGIIASRNE